MSKSTATAALAKTIASTVAKQATSKAIKTAVNTAVPIATKAAVKSMLGNRSKKTNKVAASQTTRNTRRFAPVAYSTSFTNSGKPIRISQSEIIATISPGTKSTGWWPFKKDTVMDYTALSFPINPANVTTFPWLSQIAGLFDKYRFRKLSFTFVSTKPTNTKGNVAMAYDFDAYDAVPGDMVGLSNLAKFTTTPVYVNKTIEMPLNHPGEKNWYYCADGSNGDLKTYNVGKFYLALVGAADMDTHGYIIANYDVDLVDKNPQLRTVKTVVNPDTGATSYEIAQEGLEPAINLGEYHITTLNGHAGVDDFFTLNVPSSGAVNLGFNVNIGDTIVVALDIRNTADCTPGALDTGFYAPGFETINGYLSGNSTQAYFMFVGVATSTTPQLHTLVTDTANTNVYHAITRIPATSS